MLRDDRWLNYFSLIAGRYAEGLLEPFHCARCGQPGLDPMGWDGPHEPLCAQCADGPAPPEPERPKPDLSILRHGFRAELEQVAATRRLDLKAIYMAHAMGVLRFGRICGFASWIVTDSSEICAEGRRLDGKPYRANKRLGQRKAHTIRHSTKNWPVGILPAPSFRQTFDTIAVLEGGPDLLAAIHFALRNRRTGILPVAILGRGVCRQGLHPNSLRYFKGRRVRIYPHDDPDGGSYGTAIRLAKQLERVGCEIDCFVFKGLRKQNGERIKDLNDCVEIAPEQSHKLEEVFP